MSENFDPYHAWLAIPPAEQPPDYYRLLGVTRFETSLDVIANAADARMVYVRTFQSSQRGPISQKILNELSAAKICLLDPQKKQAYDRQLKTKIEQSAGVQQSSGLRPIASELQPLSPLSIADIQQPYEMYASVNEHNHWNTPQVANAGSQAKSRPAWMIPIIIGSVFGISALLFGGIWAVIGPSTPKEEIPRQTTVSNSAVVGGMNKAMVPPRIDSKTVNVPNTRIVPPPRTVATSPVLPPTSAKVTGSGSAVASASKTAPAVASPVPAMAPIPSALTASSGSQSSTGNLLKSIPESQMKLSGKAKFINQELLLKDSFGTPAQMAIPVAIPAEYDLEVHAIREGGENGLGIGIVVGGRTCLLWVDSWQKLGFMTAISEINRLNADAPNYPGKPYHGQLLHQGTLAKIVVHVRKNSVLVVVDGKETFAWEGEPKQLGLRFNVRNVPGCILLDSWEAHMRVTHVELRPVG